MSERPHPPAPPGPPPPDLGIPETRGGRPAALPGVVWVPVATELYPDLVGRWVRCHGIRLDPRKDGGVDLRVSVVPLPEEEGGAWTTSG